MRLTTNATTYFKKNLTSAEETFNFYQNLKEQLIQIIHTLGDRITMDNDYKIDSTALDQVLIPLKISKPKNTLEINASTIFDTLNTMIMNKERTSMSINNLTLMLDETYGLQKYSK